MMFKTLLFVTLFGNILYMSSTAFAHFVAENLPTTNNLFFLENKGQVTDQFGTPRPDIQFKLGSPDLSIFIGNGKIHYQWTKTVPPSGTPISVGLRNPQGYNIIETDELHSSPLMPSIPQSWDMYRMDVELVGANKNANIIAENKCDYYERYYLPQFGEKGGVAYSYLKITYQNVYPDIDWVLYIREGKLEYDFVIRPGGKVSDIRFKYGGATSLKINEDGSLTISTPMGRITENAPECFQEDGTEVKSRFDLQNNILCFKTEKYSGTLTIDPIIEWATYYGGVGVDMGWGIDIDISGYVYMTGTTQGSANIATVGSYQNTYNGTIDAYLAKFNSAGSRMWATYYGGYNVDNSYGIAYNKANGIFICGRTNSTSGIHTAGSYQPALAGNYDAFLAKFDTTGALLWATYYGGPAVEAANSVACDDYGHVYMAGDTRSTIGIATSNSHQNSLGGGSSDNFLAKFDSVGTLQWATYYGGAARESGGSLSCDNNNNVYLAALTLGLSMNNISTANSHQELYGGGSSDVFLVKFNSNGVRLWGTYYGGLGDEGVAPSQPWNVSVNNDSFGNVYLGFNTSSLTNIATPGGYQTSLEGSNDCALVKFNSNGVRQWGTYYGGNNINESEFFSSITCYNDVIYLTGGTGSTSGIATVGQDTSYSGGSYDAFIARFSNTGQLDWGTYYGGNGDDVGAKIVYDDIGDIFLTGVTFSSNIPTSMGHQDTFGGYADAFLVKYCTGIIMPSPIIGNDTVCANTSNIYSVLPVDNAEYIWSTPSGWTGSSDSNSIEVLAGANSGLISVLVIRCNDTSNSYFESVNVHIRNLNPIITVDEFELSTTIPYTTYQWLKNGVAIPSATNSIYVVDENADYQVAVTDQNGCKDTSDVYTVTNYTGITDINSLAQSIKIYPNPSYDKVYIQAPAMVNIIINSMEGRQLLRLDNTKEIDMGNLSEGMYLLTIMDRNGTLLKTVKLTKLR